MLYPGRLTLCFAVALPLRDGGKSVLGLTPSGLEKALLLRERVLVVDIVGDVMRLLRAPGLDVDYKDCEASDVEGVLAVDVILTPWSRGSTTVYNRFVTVTSTSVIRVHIDFFYFRRCFSKKLSK